MKVRGAIAALPPSLAALAVLQCLTTPAVYAFLVPANRVRCPASAKKWARGEAWDWVDGDEGRFRDGLQNGPGRERGYYDEPVGPGYGRDRYEGGYPGGFEGGPGGYGGQREYYDEPSRYPPEYGEGFDQGPSGNQWSDEQYASPGGRGPQQFGPEGRREQYEGQRGAYYDEPRYPLERQDYQQQYRGGYPTRGGDYREQNGGYQGDGFREDRYYDEPLPQQSYEEENAFDDRPPGVYGARDDWLEQDQWQPYDDAQRPFDREQPRRPTPRSRRNGNLQTRDQARRGEIVRGGAPFGSPFGFGTMIPGFSPFAGFPMTSPFAGFPVIDPFGMMGQMDRQMDQIMQSFGSEMQRGFDEDSIEGVLEDARGYLLEDPAAADMLGDDIRLGTPFARSSSAAVVNGMRRSRLQLGIPVSGSRGAGRVGLLADGERIAQIELDVEGRTIDIPVGGRRRSNSRKIDEDGVIDANVVEHTIDAQ